MPFKYLIIYLLLAFVGTFIPIVPGAIILDGDENNIFGILLVVLGVFIFIASTVWLCIVGPKLNKQILNVKCELDSEKIKTKMVK